MASRTDLRFEWSRDARNKRHFPSNLLNLFQSPDTNPSKNSFAQIVRTEQPSILYRVGLSDVLHTLARRAFCGARHCLRLWLRWPSPNFEGTARKWCRSSSENLKRYYSKWAQRTTNSSLVQHYYCHLHSTRPTISLNSTICNVALSVLHGGFEGGLTALELARRLGEQEKCRPAC
jgi:hypothetical protein